jgi:hypothetical protein
VRVHQIRQYLIKFLTEMLLEPGHSEAWAIDVLVFLACARSYGVLLNFSI